MRFPSLRSPLMCAIAIALLMAGCTGVATREIDIDRADLHNKAVALGATGYPDASIDSSGSLKIGPDDLPLSVGQRTLAMEYREAVVDLMDLALSKTSKLSNHVVARTLFGMATGRLERTENEIDHEAAHIAPPRTSAVNWMKFDGGRSDVAVDQPAKPHANVDGQDVADCRAGRPYNNRI